MLSWRDTGAGRHGLDAGNGLLLLGLVTSNVPQLLSLLPLVLVVGGHPELVLDFLGHLEVLVAVAGLENQLSFLFLMSLTPVLFECLLSQFVLKFNSSANTFDL